MRTIISKQVIALYPGGQLLQDQYFKDIRQRIFNEDPHKQKEDAGTERAKKNTLWSPTTFGPNDRQHNPGAGSGLDREPTQQKARGVGSGYNDGEAADDETGPGNTSVVPDPYYASDVFNEIFLKHRIEQSGNQSPKNDSIKKHLNEVLSGPSVRTRAFNVDSLN